MITAAILNNGFDKKKFVFYLIFIVHITQITKYRLNHNFKIVQIYHSICIPMITVNGIQKKQEIRN